MLFRSTFNPDVTILNPSHPGSPVQHLSVTYDGAFKAGSFEVNVPDSGSYVFGTQSKVSISDQFVQAPGTSATIQYKDTLRGTIALASNLAVETTYRYVSTVPEPEAAGVAMAATTGVFMLLRRARRTGQGH